MTKTFTALAEKLYAEAYSMGLTVGLSRGEPLREQNDQYWTALDQIAHRPSGATDLEAFEHAVSVARKALRRKGAAR